MSRITDNIVASLIVIGVLFGITFWITFGVSHWIVYLGKYGTQFAYEILPPLLWLEIAGDIIVQSLIISGIAVVIEVIVILIITRE